MVIILLTNTATSVPISVLPYTLRELRGHAEVTVYHHIQYNYITVVTNIFDTYHSILFLDKPLVGNDERSLNKADWDFTNNQSAFL